MILYKKKKMHCLVSGLREIGYKVFYFMTVWIRDRKTTLNVTYWPSVVGQQILN